MFNKTGSHRVFTRFRTAFVEAGFVEGIPNPTYGVGRPSRYYSDEDVFFFHRDGFERGADVSGIVRVNGTKKPDRVEVPKEVMAQGGVI